MFNWFKKKKNNPIITNISLADAIEEKFFFVNVAIPIIIDRYDIEDQIEEFLESRGIGMVDGGGTYLPNDDSTGSCEITVLLNELNIEHFKQLANFIKENIALPKDSKLQAERGNYYSDEELKGFDDISLN